MVPNILRFIIREQNYYSNVLHYCAWKFTFYVREEVMGAGIKSPGNIEVSRESYRKMIHNSSSTWARCGPGDIELETEILASRFTVMSFNLG
jgi:hypothetical protein